MHKLNCKIPYYLFIVHAVFYCDARIKKVCRTALHRSVRQTENLDQILGKH